MKLTEILTQLQQPIPPDLISKKDTFSKGKKTGSKILMAATGNFCPV